MSSIPGLGRSPGGIKWQHTPVFLPGKPHEQRSLAVCSPQGCRIGQDLVSKHPPNKTAEHPFHSEVFLPILEENRVGMIKLTTTGRDAWAFLCSFIVIKDDLIYFVNFHTVNPQSCSRWLVSHKTT